MSADRLLSVMTRCVFNAGFNWKVIDAKWDGFEAAFEGFDPGKLAFFGDEMLDRLVSDERIVRNGRRSRPRWRMRNSSPRWKRKKAASASSWQTGLLTTSSA